MIDLDAIRKHFELVRDDLLDEHFGQTVADMDALLNEIARTSGDCYECGEFHKTHPTRDGAIGWKGHTCRCARCLYFEVESLLKERHQLAQALAHAVEDLHEKS